MIQRLNIRFPSAAAVLLLCCGLPLDTAARAEVALHSAVGRQFSLAFGPSNSSCTAPVCSLQAPDAEETSADSMHSVHISLQSRLASVFALVRRSGSLVDSAPAGGASTAHPALRTLSLRTAAWTIPEPSLGLISREQRASQLANRSGALTADYATAAFGGTCAAWDLTSSLQNSHGIDKPLAEQPTGTNLLVSAIPSPPIFDHRSTPLASGVGHLQSLPLLAASARDSGLPDAELLEPTGGSTAVRRWVMAPSVAAKFRGNGFQLISAEPAAPATAPAARRPFQRSGRTGFRRL